MSVENKKRFSSVGAICRIFRYYGALKNITQFIFLLIFRLYAAIKTNSASGLIYSLRTLRPLREAITANHLPFSPMKVC